MEDTTVHRGYPDDIFYLIDTMSKAIDDAKSIEELEAAWDHFHRVEGYVERTWPSDVRTQETCRRLKSGLSAYTRDVREGMPSPYRGWRVELSALRGAVAPQYDKNGWPK